MLEMNPDEVQQMFDLIPVMLNVKNYIYTLKIIKS